MYHACFRRRKKKLWNPSQFCDLSYIINNVNLKEDFEMKKKTFNKIASISALGAMLVPTAMSAVNADTVTKTAKTSSSVVETSSINSVAQVRDAMSKEGLNLSHVQGKYIVRKGDTLLAISQAANESMAEIAKVNHITNLNLIYVGQVLYLGSNGVVKAQSASANNEVANNAGTSVAANVMSNGGNTTDSSIVTPANSGIYRGFTGNGTVAAHPSRTAEQARNAAKVGTSANTSAKSHANATKTDTSAKVDTSTKAPAKTTSAVKSSAKASSAKTDTSKVSSSASSVKSSVASSTTSSAKHNSAVSSSTPAKASSATSSSVASSTASKPATSTTNSSASLSKAPVASSTASSQAQSLQKPAASTTSSSTASSQDYQKGVVNSDGTTNYQAAINQKGPWQGQSTTTDKFGNSPAEQTWLKNHPNAQTTGQTYADNSVDQVPVYANAKNDSYENTDRPQMSQSQLNDTNTAMQKNINASQTFGNGIQWVSSDYKGEVTGTQPVTVDNPVNTPYESYTNHAGQIDANVVKQMYGSEPGVNQGDGTYKAPEGSHYVSSNITNAGQTGGADGLSANKVTLTFYK